MRESGFALKFGGGASDKYKDTLGQVIQLLQGACVYG